MKTKHFLILLGIIFSLDAFSVKVPGQIILSNDTINVKFIIREDNFTSSVNFKNLQNKVRYIDSLGIKKVLKPEDALEIRFKYRNKTYRMLSVKYSGALIKTSLSNRIFLRILIDGKVQMFFDYNKSATYSIPETRYLSSTHYVRTGKSIAITSLSGGYYIRKGNEPFICPQKNEFNKLMIDYFSDCQKLVELIKERNLTFDSLEWILHYYNKNCNEQ